MSRHLSDRPGGMDIPGRGHNLTIFTKQRHGIGEELLTSLVVEATLEVRSEERQVWPGGKVQD